MAIIERHQQSCIYSFCSKCGRLLSLHSKDEIFKLGHNVNFCYNCGEPAKEILLNFDASFDICILKYQNEKYYLCTTEKNAINPKNTHFEIPKEIEINEDIKKSASEINKYEPEKEILKDFYWDSIIFDDEEDN